MSPKPGAHWDKIAYRSCVIVGGLGAGFFVYRAINRARDASPRLEAGRPSAARQAALPAAASKATPPPEGPPPDSLSLLVPEPGPAVPTRRAAAPSAEDRFEDEELGEAKRPAGPASSRQADLRPRQGQGAGGGAGSGEPAAPGASGGSSSAAFAVSAGPPDVRAAQATGAAASGGAPQGHARQRAFDSRLSRRAPAPPNPGANPDFEALMAALPPGAAVGDAVLGRSAQTPGLRPEAAGPPPAEDKPAESAAQEEDSGTVGSVSLDPRFGPEDPSAPSPPKLYRIGRQREERFTDARPLAATMEELGGRLVLNGSYRVRIEGETSWSAWENRDTALSHIRWRLRTRYVGDTLAVGTTDPLGKPGRTLLVRIVRRHPKPPQPAPQPSPTRPADTVGNDKIDRLHAAVWRAFPDLESWGICNCRRIAGSSLWSQHAWCNAEDLHRDVRGKSDKAAMGPVARWLYANRAQYRIQNIIWRRDPKCDDPTYDHCNHIHVDMRPTLGGTPPCAR